MSRKRLISSYAAFAAIVLATAATGVILFPLEGAAQEAPAQVRDGEGVTVQTAGSILHRSPVDYPPNALLNRVDGTVVLELTLTAQGCPSHTEISRDVRQTLLSTPGVTNAKVNVVWDPPWTPHRISAEGRRKLGIDDEQLEAIRTGM